MVIRTTVPQFFLDHGKAIRVVVYASRGREYEIINGTARRSDLLACAGTSQALVRIANNRGGQIGDYVERYEQLRASGQTVMIDGLCASACTIVLGTIPNDRICVTPNANLAFHAAWDFGSRGRTITNPEATRMLYSMYPSRVRYWIANRGGLSPRMIFLRGRQLEAMYRPCYHDARAAAPR